MNLALPPDIAQKRREQQAREEQMVRAQQQEAIGLRIEANQITTLVATSLVTGCHNLTDNDIAKAVQKARRAAWKILEECGRIDSAEDFILADRKVREQADG